MDLDKLDFSDEKKNIWNLITTPLSGELREKMKKEMIIKGLKLPNPDFNEFGLRFDIDYLNTIGSSICLLPLEFMADYVDGICKSSMDRDDGIMEQDVLSYEPTDEEIFKKVNATELGNMAYIILNTKDDMVKAKCLDLLWRYLNLYFDNLIKNYKEQSKNNPIN